MPATCRDSFFVDPPTALTVTRGELLSLRFATAEQPDELVLYRHDRLDGRFQPVFAGEQTMLAATNPSAVSVHFPEGTSWLVVASRWAQGSSVTFFEVNVRRAAAQQPALLALTG